VLIVTMWTAHHHARVVLWVLGFITNIVCSQHSEGEFPSDVECGGGELPCLSVGKQVILTSNSQLKLTCKGSQELEWDTPISENDTDALDIKEMKHEGERPHFISILMVNETIPEDTGLYTCQLKNKKQMKTSTYVYVHDLDLDEAILVNEPVVYVNVTEPLWIKCRTTLPNITVSLTTFMMEDVTGEFTWKDVTSDYEYDPQVGFKKQRSILDDSGIYSCSVFNSTDSVEVHVIDPTAPTPAPPEPFEHVLAGSTLAIFENKSDNVILALLIVTLIICIILGIFSCYFFNAYRKEKSRINGKNAEDTELNNVAVNQGYDACADD
ncbi:unnamed protein product, partial [Meganyctiphanes norvegica]